MIRNLLRRRRWLLLSLAVVTVTVLLLNSTAGPFRTVSGKGVTAEEANKRLWNCLVPPSATDVWYQSSYRATRVECTLERDVFEEWCRSRRWQCSTISRGDPANVISQRDGPLSVRRGVHFWDSTKDLGYSGVYDADRKRAFVTFTGG